MVANSGLASQTTKAGWMSGQWSGVEQYKHLRLRHCFLFVFLFGLLVGCRKGTTRSAYVCKDRCIDISHTHVHIRGEDEVDRITLSIHSN